VNQQEERRKYWPKRKIEKIVENMPYYGLMHKKEK